MIGYDYELDYEDKFPIDMDSEEKAALAWKIERDYESSHLEARAFKDAFITFAFNFYTRNPESVRDVVEQYRAWSSEAWRRGLAEVFVNDMKNRMHRREEELVM